VSNSKKLALIAIGYVLSVVVGFVAAAVKEALMPDDVAQGSPGMVAFGGMILFIFVTGFFSLGPTWVLLKLLVAAAPRTLLTSELLIAAMGPVSWLAMTIMAVMTPPGGLSLQNVPQGDLCAELHNRMPVVLGPQVWSEWLGEEPADLPRLMTLLAPYPAEEMTCWPVSTRVGNVKNNDASLIEPIAVGT
jgi:SOS response associated peptidase (SRAP)